MKNFIYRFNNKIRPRTNDKNLLGGKGANLAEMGKLGLPVPPGFTISTEMCDFFYKNKKKIPKLLLSKIKKEIKIIEKLTKKKIWRFKQPTFAVSEIGSSCFNARHDGYYFKLGA